MSRIDAIAATQVAEAVRPVQATNDRALQAQQAQVQSMRTAPTGTSARADDVRAAAAQLKQVVETTSNRRLAFAVDDQSGQMFVMIRDAENGTVIKQIPSEELLRLKERLGELVGVLFDKEA